MQKNWQHFVSCCLVAQSYLTVCNPMNCSTPGFPVLHHLLEFFQSHVHWICDAIRLSDPVSPFFSCPQPFPASGLFQWIGSWHQVAKVLELLHQSFQWIFRVDFMIWFPCCPTGSQESFPTPLFESICGIQPSLWSNSHICTRLLEKL